MTGLPVLIALGYNHLLDEGDLFRPHLHTHIPSGNHYSVSRFYDFIDILHAFLVLDLGDYRKICPRRTDSFPHRFHTFRRADEGGSHHICTVLPRTMSSICLGDRRQI